MAWKRIIFIFTVAGLVSGCAQLPVKPSVTGKVDSAVVKEIMERKDRIVQMSSQEADGNKPALLLLHGATDDPTEMMDIVQEWRGKYNVFLYAYNYHGRVQKVALDFVNEVKRIKAKNSFDGGVTIVVYSYAAIVFREAVTIADDRTLFSDASLIQLVPTAGGSSLARGMKNPITAWVVSLFSKPAYAENPYGGFAEQLWAGAGNRKFYEVINPERMHTILLEGDPHSLAGIANKKMHERYENGIGLNLVVIPKSTGVTHDYLPTNPVALGYLRKLLEVPHDDADHNKMQTAVQNQNMEHKDYTLDFASGSLWGISEYDFCLSLLLPDRLMSSKRSEPDGLVAQK
jgi:hypothetical protein